MRPEGASAFLGRKASMCRPRVLWIVLKVADCRLAMLEMKMTLAAFIISFDANLKEPNSDPPYFYDRFLTEKGPLDVIIYPRQRWDYTNLN